MNRVSTIISKLFLFSQFERSREPINNVSTMLDMALFFRIVYGLCFLCIYVFQIFLHKKRRDKSRLYITIQNYFYSNSITASKALS